jgi:hypothetical protein
VSNAERFEIEQRLDELAVETRRLDWVEVGWAQQLSTATFRVVAPGDEARWSLDEETSWSGPWSHIVSRFGS